MVPVPAPHRVMIESSGSKQLLKAKYTLLLPTSDSQECSHGNLSYNLVVNIKCASTIKQNALHIGSMFDGSKIRSLIVIMCDLGCPINVLIHR